MVPGQSCLYARGEREPVIVLVPGSSVHGIFQARVLEWVAIAFSRDTTYIMQKQQSDLQVMKTRVKKSLHIKGPSSQV